MTQLFRNVRLYTYIALFMLTGTVLGIAAQLASVFLPNLHHDFTIYSLVCPSITIFVLILLVIHSQPRIEAFVFLLLGILWLTLAAWQSDVIGPIECFALSGQTTQAKNGGTFNAQQYCYESKVIEAFSWAVFIIILLTFLFVIVLANKARGMGRAYAWSEDINELPWFYEYQGIPPVNGAYPYYPQPGQGYSYNVGGQIVQQMPGHSLVIQPGVNGAPATVQQVPGAVQSSNY